MIAKAGGLGPALASGALPQFVDVTLAEAIVLGLLGQGLRKYVGVLGHGSTELAEVLRVYESAGLVKVYNTRHETEASHAAAALRWVTGEKAAVVTSIGPGAMHALAGALVPASDGLGVWYLLGDETTEDEGPNMQQIPGRGQNSFHRLCSALGEAYTLHTPLALSAALRRGLVTVDHPHRPGPFFLLMPMNTQPAPLLDFNLEELPSAKLPRMAGAPDQEDYERALQELDAAEKVVVKVGGGARGAGENLVEFLELVDGVAVTSPLASGVIPYHHPRNMLVGGSKGTICGNYAMEEADLLVAIGSRFVCQSDCSRTGYPKVKQVIAINTGLDDVMHYNQTIALWGDTFSLAILNSWIKTRGLKRSVVDSSWLRSCLQKKAEWEAYKALRYNHPCLPDEVWGGPALTQPAAIKTATDFARNHDWVTFFDAGDAQANGFQIVEDDRPGRTFTETGASYMGFAVSALLCTALSEKPFYALAVTGDGSFMMNPQILLDGVQHGARGCILLLDNRRMAAISALQEAQYGHVFATADQVAVDYVALAGAIQGVKALAGGRTLESLTAALHQALEYPGLSLIHLPVYYGPDPLGGLGAFGRWNVGNWVFETQKMRHKIGL